MRDNRLEIDFKLRETGSAYRQIADRIEMAIRSGGLTVGDRLPSTRALAGQLDVARGTVKAAYAHLSAMGLLESRGAGGTVVAEWGGTSTRPPSTVDLSAMTARDEPDPPMHFQLGLPALDSFPRKSWSRLLVKRSRMIGAETMHYPAPTGLEALRAEIAAYLAIARGIDCRAEQVLITGGYQDSLSLICDGLVARGDRVAVEDPGYERTRRIVRAAGAGLRPVAVDRHGLCVEALIAASERCHFAVVTPAHQFPMTVSLAAERWAPLLEWAEASEAYVVEDDYDGEFHYCGLPPRALKSVDRSDRVIYLGTFSKSLFPALRLGYVVVPAALCARFCEVARRRGTARPSLEQRVVADFMSEGYFFRHLDAMRRLYASRRERLVTALGHAFGEQVRISNEGGGIHFIASFTGLGDNKAATVAAAREGLFLLALEECAVRDPVDPGAMLMSFTNVPEARAQTLADRLAGVLTPLLDRSG